LKIYIYIANWDGRIKLKTNKTSIRGSRKKIQNQKNKDWSSNTNNKEGQTIIFKRKEIKEGKQMSISDNPVHHRQHVPHY
jgi:hypothetical protein